MRRRRAPEIKPSSARVDSASAVKVRTGHFIEGKTRRRAVWVPKVLVEKGIIKVKKDVKFRMDKYGGKPL